MARFLRMAMKSASEFEYHLLLANDLEFLDHGEYQRLNSVVIELKRMLASFTGRLKAER